MGALHEGHLSLIRRARQDGGFVVVSVFVNPTQFGPSEDLDRYPRRLDTDVHLAAEAGGDLVFAPGDGEMYVGAHATWVDVERVSAGLCGASRPGHFRGVCTIVTKLFNLCRPDRAYFGQKDAQQLAVVRRMVRDLDQGVDVIGCPIVREQDGLAMSSRNAYLSSEEREQAVVLSRALREAERLVGAGERDANTVERSVCAMIGQAPLATIDYVAIVDVDELQPLARIEEEGLLALAVRFGKTRLIDNTVLKAAKER